MTNGNDPAYPRDNLNQITTGLTKRELFAAMAMQGLCSIPFSGMIYQAKEQFKDRADASVKYADALIAALNQGEK